MEQQAEKPTLKEQTLKEIEHLEADIHKKESELALLRDSLKKCKKALKALES